MSSDMMGVIAQDERKKEGQVQIRLKELECQINELIIAVTQFEDRLNRVLSVPEGKKQGTLPAPEPVSEAESVPLAKDLLDLKKGVIAARIRMDSIMSRLEI